MKQEETSELLFTRLRQPQTLTALLCFVSHFARIAVEEKGPDRIIRQGWSFVANISTNPKFHGWMRHLSHTPCHNASGIASRFANFEKFERAKRWRRFRQKHPTSNGQFLAIFHHFSMFSPRVWMRSFVKDYRVWDGMTNNPVRDLEILYDTLGAVTLQKHAI